MATSASAGNHYGMWFRSFFAQLDDVTDMLKSLSKMLMHMDVKLDRIVEILEEDV
jgi:hypothetical protein